MNAVAAQFLIAGMCILFGWASLYGWGILAKQIAGGPKGLRTITIALGLAAVLFIGAFANLARIAYSPTLWAIWATGLFLFIFNLRATFAFKIADWKWPGGALAWIEFATAEYLLPSS